MDGQALTGTIHTTPEVGKNTGNPLVIKGVERIESIILPGDDIRLDAELYSHLLSRVMRRDFNFTSVKLFWYTKGFHRRLHARSMLHKLTGEAERLEDMARPYDMPEGTPAATCTMRIVSEEAELIFHALVKADRALHTLMHSPLAKVAEENMGPFLRVFTLLRKEVFRFTDDQRQRASGQGNSTD